MIVFMQLFNSFLSVCLSLIFPIAIPMYSFYSHYSKRVSSISVLIQVEKHPSSCVAGIPQYTAVVCVHIV